MIKRLSMTTSQQIGYDAICEKEARFLMACLHELGGSLNDPWQFDKVTRTFWMEAPADMNEAQGISFSYPLTADATLNGNTATNRKS